MTTLMAIGGAVDLEEPVIFEEFVRRAGGEKAKIVVLPQASRLAYTGKEYARMFQKLGVKKSRSLEFRERQEVDGKRHLVGPGVVIFIPPKVKHAIINTGFEDLIFVVAASPPQDMPK